MSRKHRNCNRYSLPFKFLAYYRPHRTIFAIDLLFATISAVSILDEATSAEQGTQEELLAQNGVYARLCELGRF